MLRACLSVAFLGLCLLTSARAVGTVTSGTDLSNYTYTYVPTNAATPGASYVGVVFGAEGAASGVYLGNGWVLTAAHIGIGDFGLNGSTYSAVAGSSRSLTSGRNTADLTLYQIANMPNLAPLSLISTAPTEMSPFSLGSSVVMTGYGGNGQETFGINTVTYNDFPVSISANGMNYTSNDFLTFTGTYSEGFTTSQNQAQVVSGDSGGGDFINVNGQWVLAGINEVNGTVTDQTNTSYTISGMVELDTYAAQISSITGVAIVPEPRTGVLLILGLGVIGLYLSRRRSA